MQAASGPGSAIASLAAVVLSILALGATFTAAPTAASTYIVGSPLTADFSVAFVTFSERETLTNVFLPEPGANVTSPVDGTITGWRMAYANGGPFTLRVLEPHGDGTYTAVASSAAQMPAGPALESFPTDLPIKAGDTVGLDNATKTDTIGAATPPEAGFGVWKPFLAEGERRAPTVFSGEESVELAFDAVVVAHPAVVLLSPAGGSVGGGTAVAIAGHDLKGATAVRFGSAAAKFSVVSDNLITATSPAVEVPGGVDVTVTTQGGQSTVTPAGRFVYADIPSCIVPRLTGKSLKAGRRSLKKAGCALGRATGRKGKAARVKKQSPKPGTVLPAGGKVSIKLR